MTTTLNKTLDELKFDFSDINGILHDAFSLSGVNSVSSIKNNSNITRRKRRYDNIENTTGGINVMQTKLSEAENELLKKSSAQIVSATSATTPQLDTYQNNLPYGVAGNQVNDELYAVGENTWGQFSKDMGKIFKKVGKEQLNAMSSNNSHLKGSDIENMVYGTCGSLSEWPQINPKSAGMGKCSKLFEVFNNHYKRYNGKIDESKFYSDLMSSLHTSEIFALSGKKTATGINGFSNEVKVYNIDTSLWFPTDEERIGKEAEYNGFVRTGNDSYGNFFDIEGFPIALPSYNDCLQHINNPLNNGKLPLNYYTTYNNQVKVLKKCNGSYSEILQQATIINIMVNNSIVLLDKIYVNDIRYIKNISKKYCSLFLHEADETAIGKIIEISKKPTTYLFNVKKQGIFYAACALPSNTPNNCQVSINRKNDILFTQKIPEIGIILFLRKIFQEIYPIKTKTGGGPVPNNQTINIFQDNANIVSGGENLDNYRGAAAFAARRTMEHATDSIDDVKKKLKEKINSYRSVYQDFNKIYIDDILIQFIDDITDENYLRDGTFAGGPDPTSKRPLHFELNYNNQPNELIQTFKGLVGGSPANYNFATGGIDHFFINDNIAANAPNSKASVLVYRHLIYRLYYKFIIIDNKNSNNNNLYNICDDDITVVRLTQARVQGAGYENLEGFKQAIPDINPIMVGGSRKSSRNNLIKTGGKKTKKIQKGGAVNTLFTGNAPKLYANRKLMNFSPSQFELAVKKYKELGFTADYTKVKSLFNKISQISHLPLFFDGYEDTLNIFTNNGNPLGGGAATPESGGCGVVPPAGNTIPISFSDVAQLFLFNSVNTTTTTLLIHFLKNVKACLNHFITTDLKVASDNLSKIITVSQADKIEGSLRELIKEIDKVVNFLKYNTLNLHEQSVRLNDDNLGINASRQFQNNEHYIKNLFLGANVYFSYNYQTPNPWQSVIMRFTNDDLGDNGRGQNQINWHGDIFFQFLNRIVGCTENSNIFGNTLKFLTDSNNPVNQALQVYQTTPAAPLTAGHNPYLEKIRPYLKDKPDGCFGGIPFVSLDPKTFSLLMRSFYLLLGLRLVVGNDIRINDRIEEETAYSILSQDRKDAIRKNIQDTLTISAFSTLAESLKSQRTINQANMIFNTIFRYLFMQSRRLIAQVNQAKLEINKAKKVGNKKNTKKGLFTGGGPTSIYTFRQTSNANTKNSLIKSEVNFIKTTYQSSAEFEFIMNEILIQIKKEIERRGVKNELHFYYYIDTHFRNFKIYMTTYLLTIGDNNIPPEMAENLQKYISYSPDKNKAVDSYKKLTQIPLIDPQYSNPLWWAKIEKNFMDIQEIGVPSSDTIYRLFIITTTPPSKLKARDLYIVDALALATLNDSKSKSKYWITTTGDRTHVGIKKAVDSANNKIYLDTNTIIKLTGVKSSGLLGLKRNSTKAIVSSQKITPFMDKNINKAIRGAIDEDIRDLISGKYKYFDKKDNRYKTLIPLFLQAGKNDLLQNIVSKQKDIMFRGYEHKFSFGINTDYKIYQLSDDYIKDLKKYRQWLYQIFIEQQMQLTKPETEKFDTIETSMISSFKGWLFSTNTTGKCTRVYNIYDYIVLQATDATRNTITGNKKMSNFRNPTDPYKPGGRIPATIDFKTIRSPDPNLSNTYDLGAKMMAGFISRESLIKLMLIY
jgi:hypothetical protein